MPTISITVISDPVCPWCFIGALRLSRAMALYLKTVSSTDTITTKWHAYQLDPNTPPQPLITKIASKWGEDQVPSVKARLNGIAKQEGVEFNFNSTIGNTRDAHRLEKLGRNRDGGDITSKEDLVTAAVKAGLERDEAREWLDGDHGGEEVDNEAREMQEKGIRGVPRYIINDKYTVDGAEDVGDILEKLVMAREDLLAKN
ncbi:dithiol-disulfide isomerase [Fusarium coicis]|nr:dithiol-disulfide isomerase [Fusarium coicis]